LVKSVKEHDVISPIETWCSKMHDYDIKAQQFTEFFRKSGTKKEKHGRHSGGILVLVKKKISHYFMIH